MAGSLKTVIMVRVCGQLFVKCFSRHGVLMSRHCDLCLRQQVSRIRGLGDSEEAGVVDSGSNGRHLESLYQRKLVELYWMEIIGGRVAHLRKK